MLSIYQVTSLLHRNGNFQIFVLNRVSDGVRRCVQVGELCLFEGHISSRGICFPFAWCVSLFWKSGGRDLGDKWRRGK